MSIFGKIPSEDKLCRTDENDNMRQILRDGVSIFLAGEHNKFKYRYGQILCWQT